MPENLEYSADSRYQDINVNLLIPYVAQARKEDVEGLYETIQSGEIEELVVATGCDIKALAMLLLLQELRPPLSDLEATIQSPEFEPSWDNPGAVAWAKVLQLKAERAKNGSNREGLAVAATDLVSWLNEEKKAKLSRTEEARGYPLTMQEILSEWEELRSQFCYQGQIRIIWDMAFAVLNGGKPFEEKYILEVISDPIDPELLDHCVRLALKGDYFTKSSLRIAAIECLLAADKIRTVALMSDELRREGVSLPQMRQDVSTASTVFNTDKLLSAEGKKGVFPEEDLPSPGSALDSILLMVLSGVPDLSMNR